MYLKKLLIAILISMLCISCVGNLPFEKENNKKAQKAGPVKQFAATSGANKVDLSWNNPSEEIQAIKILRKTGGYSTSHTDGTVVYQGTSTSTADTGTSNYVEYYYTAYAVGTSGDVSDPAKDKTASCPATTTCPSNYVLVPANKDVGVYCPFCIAKYEMRNVSDSAVSQETGSAWNTIGFTVAQAKCTNIGTGYHLMTNPERLAISRNIETVASNWTGNAVGSGTIVRGWSASELWGDAYSAGNAANSTAACLYLTGAGTSTCSSTGDASKRRTHDLSNGSVIWDFTGNLNEWIDWTATLSEIPTPYDGNSNGTVYLGYEFSAVTAGTTTPDAMWKPTSSYTSAHGYGRYYRTRTVSNDVAAQVAGNWAFGGLFGLQFSPSDTYGIEPITGFRCAYTP